MIRICTIEKKSKNCVLRDETYLKNWKKSDSNIIWIDFESEDLQNEREILEKLFEINSLAVDDAQRDRHPPKLEWFDDHFFLLLKAFTAKTNSSDFGILHISFFVGKNFLLTRHDGVSPSINKIWELNKNGKLLQGQNPLHICYRIIRTIIDRYTPIILDLEKRLEQMEEQMIEDPSDTLLGELINYNSSLKKLRRIFGYQQSILSSLAKSDRVTADQDRIHEYQDIQEQMERLASLSALLQELTRDLIDGYISVTSHRLNNIMKVLTIVTVFFLPLTFMAGIYGMNFENMPELKQENAYFVLLSIMAVSVISLIVVFRKLKWI